jgi:hypothetical protein
MGFLDLWLPYLQVSWYLFMFRSWISQRTRSTSITLLQLGLFVTISRTLIGSLFGNAIYSWFISLHYCQAPSKPMRHSKMTVSYLRLAPCPCSWRLPMHFLVFLTLGDCLNNDGIMVPPRDWPVGLSCPSRKSQKEHTAPQLLYTSISHTHDVRWLVLFLHQC